MAAGARARDAPRLARHLLEIGGSDPGVEGQESGRPPQRGLEFYRVEKLGLFSHVTDIHALGTVSRRDADSIRLTFYATKLHLGYGNTNTASEIGANSLACDLLRLAVSGLHRSDRFHVAPSGALRGRGAGSGMGAYRSGSGPIRQAGRPATRAARDQAVESAMVTTDRGTWLRPGCIFCRDLPHSALCAPHLCEAPSTGLDLGH